MENNEAEKIQEAQVSVPEKMSDPTVSIVRKRKRDFFVELALFFILGILIGVAVKTEAMKYLTMGFEDYKMKVEKQDYKITDIQKDLAAEEVEAQEQAAENMPTEQESGNEAENSPVENAPAENAETENNQN